MNPFCRIVLLVLILTAGANSYAELSATLNGTGGSYTFTFDPVGDTISISGTPWDFHAAGYSYSETGSYGAFSASPQTLGVDAGATEVWVRITRQGSLVAGPVKLSNPAPLGLSFRIPANSTAYPVVYKFMQGNTEVASLTQAPGAGAQTFHVNGLTTDGDVYMVEYTGSLSRNESGGIVFIPMVSWQVVNVGKPTIGGSTPVDGAPSPIGPAPAAPPPTAPTAPPPAPTAAPAAPAPTLQVAAGVPTPKPTPHPTPSGTGGVTKQDLETQTNEIVDAINKTNEVINENSNTVVGAVNKAAEANRTGQNAIIDAVNKTAVDSNASATKQLEAQNKAQGSLDRINSTLATVNSNSQFAASRLASINSQLAVLNTAITGGPEQTPAAYPATFTGTLAASSSAPVTTLVGKLPAVPNVLPTDIGSNSHFVFSLKFPPLTETFTVDVDMAPYATPITFVRNVMKACLTILFFFLVINALRKAVA